MARNKTFEDEFDWYHDDSEYRESNKYDPSYIGEIDRREEEYDTYWGQLKRSFGNIDNQMAGVTGTAREMLGVALDDPNL